MCGYGTKPGSLHSLKLTWLAGTSTIWRCISYWKWEFSNVMLVFRGGSNLWKHHPSCLENLVLSGIRRLRGEPRRFLEKIHPRRWIKTPENYHGGAQNYVPWKRWLLLNMAIFGIYVKFLGCNSYLITWICLVGDFWIPCNSSPGFFKNHVPGRYSLGTLKTSIEANPK